MEVQFGPNPLDVPNLLYKLQRKIQLFNTNESLPNRGYNLVTSSSKYAIVFVASPDGLLLAYYLNQLIDKECEAQHLTIRLPEKPSHIAVSCDQELLAIAGGQLLYVYKVTDFQNLNVSPSVTMKCDVNPNTFVSALQWNPCMPDTIAVAFYDGTLLVSQVTTGQINKVQSKARCICWSPKGKQLVTGNSDGTLCQYKPNLTPAKTVPAPNLFEGAPVETLAIYWIATYQFAVVYKNAADNSRPSVTVVNIPKVGQSMCYNYEDICYSMGSSRPWYYYLQGLAQWNIILASSSNSMEIATFGSADGVNWQQWCQMDEARPELPLTDKKIENYPIGICIDTCAIHQLPWGENEVLPHMPLLLVVSHTGLLSIFNMINMNQQAGQLCCPPQMLQLPAAALTADVPGEQAPVTIPVAPAAQPKPEPVQSLPPLVQPTPVSSVPASVFASMSANLSKPALQQPQLPQAVSTVPVAIPQIPQQPAEVKPTAVPVVQAQTQVQVKAPATPAPKPQSLAQTQEVNAALKAEKERADKIKANKELKDMLIREVNEFQMELYKFMLKTRETQVKLQRDIMECGVPRLENSTYDLQAMDTEQLKKDCTLEELRSDIVQLKLELVRACAVVAEARTHAEAKDLHQWTQVDPLTTKRVSTVKKLVYYVQNQVDQAQKELDYKWNEIAARDMKMHKPGQRMIRPILDDVYQPLVKQQEILSRQQAVLRTLRNTLKECEMTPLFKSASLLRSTPFRNKDPLSKLTKNILNMSIEPETKPKEPLLNAQKLDALRDMLSNHKTIKIKPVNVEMRQRLAAMKINYEKSLKEKAAEIAKAEQNTETPKLEPLSPVATAPSVVTVKMEAKSEIKEPPISIPTFTPVSNLKAPPTALAHVTRTLFTDEPRSEPLQSAIQPPQGISQMQSQTLSQIQLQPIHQVQPQPINQVQPQPINQVQPQSINQVQLQPTKQVQLQPISQVQPQAMKPQTSFTFAAPTITNNTRSVLKDLLKNKQALTDAKNEANLFNICSPTAFTASVSTPPVSPGTNAPINVFTAKPISDINNKFQPQAFVSEPKPQTRYVKPQSSETGEIETPVVAKFEDKEEEKPFTSLFSLKTSTPFGASPQIVPDVLNVKVQNKPAKSVEKIAEKLKENVPEKPVENITQSVPSKAVEDKNDVIKPLGVQTTNKSIFSSAQTVPIAQTVNKSIFGSIQPAAPGSPTIAVSIASEPQKPVEIKTENVNETSKNTELPDPGTSASLFAAANASTPPIAKAQTVIASTTSSTTPVKSQEATTENETPTKILLENTAVSSASSIFGSAVAAQSSSFAPKTTQSGSLFSTSTDSTTSSVFEAAPTSAFGAAITTTDFSSSTTQSVFTSSESKPSVFSTPTPANLSVFSAVTTTTQSHFGGSAVFPTTAASVFSTSNTPSAFGSNTSSIFGGSSTSDASNLFAAAAAATTTTPSSLFGTTATPSVFGATTTGQSSVFGSSTNTSAQSVFGAATTTAQSPLFGSPSTTQSSVFGGGTSVFGSPTATTQAFGSSAATNQGSIFGSPTQPASASVFATPTTTAQGSSLFGGAEANLFAAASISTTSAPSQQTSPGSIFGGSSGSVFGGTTNVFGGKPASTQASSIFSGGTTFGQNTNNNFWSGGNATGGGFGSAFGQQATTQASTIFGGTTGGSFSAASTGQPFGSPQQSSAFGSPQQTAGSGFGGSPGFGSKAVFGQSTGFSSPSGTGGFSAFGGFNKSPTGGFGAPAAFGSGATFGGSAFGGSSPNKVFGGSSPVGFGSPTQSNATFENLATQNTLTFGNLAQQSGQPSQQQPAFNTSPSFTGWRG